MNPARSAVVAEALRWEGTPFHHGARVHGAGVDCGNLLIAAFQGAGLLGDVRLEPYPPDWHLHRTETRFLNVLLQYAHPLPAGELPQPGDIAMFDYGRHAAHGAIVVAWPVVCHAWRDVGRVVRSEADSGPLGERLAGFYRLKGLST